LKTEESSYARAWQPTNAFAGLGKGSLVLLVMLAVVAAACFPSLDIESSSSGGMGG
jgi:hypothetical protein